MPMTHVFTQNPLMSLGAQPSGIPSNQRRSESVAKIFYFISTPQKYFIYLFIYFIIFYFDATGFDSRLGCGGHFFPSPVVVLFLLSLSKYLFCTHPECSLKIYIYIYNVFSTCLCIYAFCRYFIFGFDCLFSIALFVLIGC